MVNKVTLGFIILVVLLLYVNVGRSSKDEIKDDNSFVVSLLFYMSLLNIFKYYF